VFLFTVKLITSFTNISLSKDFRHQQSSSALTIFNPMKSSITSVDSTPLNPTSKHMELVGIIPTNNTNKTSNENYINIEHLIKLLPCISTTGCFIKLDLIHNTIEYNKHPALIDTVMSNYDLNIINFSD